MTKKYQSNAEYNKLVRDRVLEFIEKDNLISETRTLTKEETIKLLKEKIIEEGRELIKAENVKEEKKEMADILEIIMSLSDELGFDMAEIEKLRQERAEKRGRFKKRIFLIKTRSN